MCNVSESFLWDKASLKGTNFELLHNNSEMYFEVERSLASFFYASQHDAIYAAIA